MNDKETIRDMQKIMEYCCNVYDNKGNHIRNKCNTYDCEYFCETNNVCCSFRLKEATALYNAGYRKIPEGSVVLTEDEVYEFRKDSAEVKFLKNKIIEQARKETVKAFAKELLNFINLCDDMEYSTYEKISNKIDEIAKKYGVEE